MMPPAVPLILLITTWTTRVLAMLKTTGPHHKILTTHGAYNHRLPIARPPSALMNASDTHFLSPKRGGKANTNPQKTPSGIAYTDGEPNVVASPPNKGEPSLRASPTYRRTYLKGEPNPTENQEFRRALKEGEPHIRASLKGRRTTYKGEP
jgi:hypothetical protein